MTRLRVALARTSWPGALWGAACGLVIAWDHPARPAVTVVGTALALAWVVAAVGHAWPTGRDR